MTDLTITATSVLAGGNAVVENGVAGVAITAGQVVYLDPATGTFKLADNNLAGAEVVTGIALNGAAIGQRVAVQSAGDITIGATLVKGTAYCLSATAGMIAPAADITTGNTLIQLGLAKSTTVLALKINAPGITL